MRTIERNLSTGRSSSKKNLQAEDFTSSLSKTETSENIEDNEEAENERRKKGMKKIEDNNLKLDDLHEHIKNIRAETEEIRRENAKMFHIYKESFIIVIQMHFKFERWYMRWYERLVHKSPGLTCLNGFYKKLSRYDRYLEVAQKVIEGECFT